ncbi:hypothetical protein ACFFGV_05465 [Pontibacillus salicampi]|uniref:Uncharacterized protein n=1 Tax=Pontibacillus salicampi TaxID=1449801 RepID=A0ABV6LL28_9BACI
MAIAKGWTKLVVLILLLVGNYIGAGIGAWFSSLI